METTRKGTGPAKPKDPERERIGETLRTLRERYGYTQEQFGTALGISRSYISLIEAGIKPLPDRLLSRSADLLGIKPLAIKHPEHAMDVAA
jgi:transcriptional regulator with XRE-family HTH domain